MAEEALKRFNGKDKPYYNRPFKINWGSNKKATAVTNNMDTQNQEMQPVSMRSNLSNFITPGSLNLLTQQNQSLNEEQQLKAKTLEALGLSKMVEYQQLPNSEGQVESIPIQMSNFQINPSTLNPENPTSIYVGDLDPKCANSYLEDVFKSRYKTISGAKIIKDPTTRNSKGYGFVMFASPEEAERAIHEMNGFQVLSRKIRTGKSINKNTTIMPPNSAMSSMMQQNPMTNSAFPYVQSIYYIFIIF